MKAVDRANDARKITDKGEDLSDIVRHADDLPTPHAPVKSADDLITVRHYTDAATARRIEGSRYLARDSWVTLPQQMKGGMKQNDIADLLALPYPSRAECYIDVQVRLSDLYIDSIQGLKAQPSYGWKGGGFLYRLVNDIPIENARFLPTFW